MFQCNGDKEDGDMVDQGVIDGEMSKLAAQRREHMRQVVTISSHFPLMIAEERGTDRRAYLRRGRMRDCQQSCAVLPQKALKRANPGGPSSSPR